MAATVRWTWRQLLLAGLGFAVGVPFVKICERWGQMAFQTAFGPGEKLTFGAGEVYYTSKVTADEARKLGDYLLKNRYFNHRDQRSIQLDRAGRTYAVRLVMRQGKDQDQKIVLMAEACAKILSRDVFRGEPVDIHMCDERLRTLRVIR